MNASSNPEDQPRELVCVVVEDQGLFLELLSGMLSIHSSLRVAARALDVAGGKAACSKHEPDLLVLDLDLPDGSGLDVAKHLLELQPNARVIIVSGHAGEFVCPSWLGKNLQAIISKNDTFASLRAELDEILAIENSSPPPQGKKNFTNKPLTAREAEILALIGEGLTSKEIGARLNLSKHTVQTHRKRMAIKLGTTGPKLVRFAIAQRQAFFAAQGGR